MVAPGDQTAGKGENIFVPCVAVSIGADISTSITWTRRKLGSQGSRGESEVLTNRTDRVSIFHTVEERPNGVVVVRSVLEIGCVDLEDAGVYSCHSVSTSFNKTAEFLINVKGD